MSNRAAQFALLTFGVAVLAGLFVGNTTTTILTRALACMGLALLMGFIASFLVRLVLRDSLQQRLTAPGAVSAEQHTISLTAKAPSAKERG